MPGSTRGSEAITSPTPDAGDPSDHRWTSRALRWAAFLFVVIVGCPIRFWALADDFDNSWVFAVNYAAAHGYAFGRDIVFNTGPLGYLIFPMDVGNNLNEGLLFQSVIWLVLAGVFFDVFFRGGFAAANVAVFALCFGLAAPLFWFNRVGVDNLLLTAALLELVAARFRGATRPRLVVALILTGLMAMMKFSSAVIALGALAGFVFERLMRNVRAAVTDGILAAVLPAAVVVLVGVVTLPSMADSYLLFKGFVEITEGYPSALSSISPTGMSAFSQRFEILAAVAVMGCIGAVLAFAVRRDSRYWFFCLLLAAPLLISFKHAFVRHDHHAINFFCFAVLATGLLALPLPTVLWGRLLTTVLITGSASQLSLAKHMNTASTLAEQTGLRVLQNLREAVDARALRATLRARSERDYRPEFRLEPELRQIISDESVSFLSYAFSGSVAFDNLRFIPHPLLQRANAYTPYLDSLSAEWVSTRGPHFLVFDGRAIDARHPWMETPAMWLEIFKWYDTRLLGSRNLLLERRKIPRPGSLTVIRRVQWNRNEPLRMPDSPVPVFWRMDCRLSLAGRARKALLRLPVTTVETTPPHGPAAAPLRAIPELFVAPMPGNTLPSTLAEFAAFFEENGIETITVDRLQLSGYGATFYDNLCDVEFLKAPLN